MSRFDSEVSGVFYEVIIMRIICKLEQPSIAEIRREIAKLADGKYVRTESSDKQLIGRMDKTFGLIDCVAGSGMDRRFRINEKGAALLKKSTNQVIEPVIEILQNG